VSFTGNPAINTTKGFHMPIFMVRFIAACQFLRTHAVTHTHTPIDFDADAQIVADHHIDLYRVASILTRQEMITLASLVSAYGESDFDRKAFRAAYVRLSRDMIAARITLDNVAAYKATVQRPAFSAVTVSAVPGSIADRFHRFMGDN
jgi:hypothetical protein